MKKKIITIGCIILGVIAITLGLILVDKNQKNKNKIEILDATYACNQVLEKFYEDDDYTYYFPCTKSNSIYVKYKDGSKTLVVSALEDKKVTINELIDAGLDVVKKEK